MAGWISLAPAAPGDPRAAALRARGWAEITEPACEGLTPQQLYEAAGEEDAVEFYQTAGGPALAAAESWPPAPRTCRPISEPSDVEEVK